MKPVTESVCFIKMLLSVLGNNFTILIVKSHKYAKNQ